MPSSMTGWSYGRCWPARASTAASRTTRSSGITFISEGFRAVSKRRNAGCAWPMHLHDRGRSTSFVPIQQMQDRHRRLCQIGQRVALDMLEKRPLRLEQNGFERAAFLDDAHRIIAVDRCERGFHEFNHLSQIDALLRLAEPDTAMLAPARLDQSRARQLFHDFHDMTARYVELLGNLLHG